MKNRIFIGGLFILFLFEVAAFSLLIFPKSRRELDTVAVNEAIKTVQNDWDKLTEHVNHTSLDYVILDTDSNLLYRTRSGLSESINAAISHKDTILDIEMNGRVVGKIIIYNNDFLVFQSENQAIIFAVALIILLQCCLCIGYLFYIRYVIIKPFCKMKSFAERIAGGNLDIPLEMDRQNLFGVFTESFDLMRSELKKARLAEAKANESKKELVAKLSHDIRTPVASIKAASEVGAALSSDGKSKANYEQIIQKADQINALVTNLFSATLEELQELPVTPSDIKSDEVQALLENADYLHRAVIPPIPACMLFADCLRLQQVFDNIFANSYKYSDTKIRINICMTTNYLFVSIEDYGGGVAESELPLLKEKFKRGSNTNGVDGAGLGLYIADYCMSKMQGRLAISNGTNGLNVTVWIALRSAI